MHSPGKSWGPECLLNLLVGATLRHTPRLYPVPARVASKFFKDARARILVSPSAFGLVQAQKLLVP